MEATLKDFVQNARKGSGESPQILRRMPIFDSLLEEIFQEINDEFFKLPLFQVSIQCLNQKKSNIAKYISLRTVK